MIRQHIYLSGFMGSGKTTVGEILANRLGLRFVDTDSLIEKKTGMTLPQIFSKKGESFFREQERQVLLAVSHSPPSVVSLGGGLILFAGNRDVLKAGIWVNLKTTAATLIKRLESVSETLVPPQKKISSKGKKGSKTKTKMAQRPLLGIKIKRENVEELLRQRRPYYDLAPYQIETDGLGPDAVAGKICSQFASN